MVEIKEPEIYDTLRSLEIADLDPKEFLDRALFYTLSWGLEPPGITEADLKSPLTGDKRLAMQKAVDEAVVKVVMRAGGHDIIPADMEAGPAKAYADGHCKKHFMQLRENVQERSPSSTGSVGYNNEGGPYYHRIVDTCCNIANCWRRLPEQLDEAAGKEGAAQAVFDALGKALVQYRAISQLIDGITQEGIPSELVNEIFRYIFSCHRVLFKRTAASALAATKPLGAEKVTEAGDWVAATHARLKTAQKAVGTDKDMIKETE